MTVTRRVLSAVLVLMMLTSVVAAEQPVSTAPAVPTSKWAAKRWIPRHEKLLSLIKVRGERVHLVFVGDSITNFFPSKGKTVWQKYYGSRGALNLGFAGDCTENVLWRLQHGEIDGIKPKLAILMVGTNNTGIRMDSPADIAAGVKANLDEMRKRMPNTKIILLAIFPRNATPNDKLRVNNEKANVLIEKLADNQHIFWMNINKVFLTQDGTLTKEMMPDMTHPSEKAYELWAEAIEPTVKKLMGE